MQVIQDALHAPDLPHGTILTIGNYDGVHLGQQQVLERVVERARAQGLHSAVLTFDPHPLAVLRPEARPPQLSTPAQKEALLDKTGIDFVLVVEFTPEFSQTSARSFVRDFLHERLGASEIHVGGDFSFGHGREGDVTMLRQMGEELGFETFAVDEVSQGGERISSTRIRTAVGEGRVEDSRRLLGRPYSLTGIIVRGDRMGQRLGWPTINLAPDNDLVPADGVYATRTVFPSFPSVFDSVTNIGTRPTVYENYERVVETHVLDFRNDVYGERVEIGFYKRLREEQMFQSMMDLSAQIARDVEATREFFRSLEEFEESESSGLGLMPTPSE